MWIKFILPEYCNRLWAQSEDLTVRITFAANKMSSDSRTVAVVPLNGGNYPTWKVQCRMALLKDGLWGLASGTEHAPDRSASAEQRAKFTVRRDKALATIVLAIEPKLLYLLGNPEDPAVVWKKLSDQFQKKTWANKLELRRKLFSLRLSDGVSVQEHLKAMTEILDELSVIDEPVNEEDRVVHLLASLPESYNVLVTALEANAEVPKLEVVTERLLHEERKQRARADHGSGSGAGDEEALAAKYGKGPRCHFCKKFGHIKRNCDEFARSKNSFQERKKWKQGAYKATTNSEDNSDSESISLVARQALSASTIGLKDRWIVDSGATCHMYNNRDLFVKFQVIDDPLEVTLGDGRALKATGRGTVMLKTSAPDGKKRECSLRDALLVPGLAYNLLSVSRTTEAGKVVEFSREICSILEAKDKRIVAAGSKVGSLYYLDQEGPTQQAHLTKEQSKETVWHRRFGHLGIQNLQQLARDRMVEGFDFDPLKTIDFCESCVKGKHHRTPFPTSNANRSKQPLDLIHSDVCGKIDTPSRGKAEYFLTLIDDYTHYTWVYALQRKSQVFEYFVKWKSLIEKSSGVRMKTLRTDNGGEYTSTEFKEYLAKEGIRHDLTVPKNPEQNGVAERMNRTLVESVRSMLADSGLSKRFWAEALSTAVFLRNRSPTKCLEGVTPAEAWTGEKPDVSTLRIFGCTAYSHMPKDERQKLDSTARKCVFLGYGSETKCYRLYDPDRDRVILSRDVRFNEREKPEQEEDKQVEVECSEEPKAGEESPIHGDNEPEPDIDTTPDLPPRRSERERRNPDWYGGRVAAVATDQLNEPSNLKEAMSSSERSKWQEAMKKEINSLQANEVWDLVKLPPGRKVVGSKWVFKRKLGPDGLVERHKARLVAQGFSQKFGWDYEETFSPVVRGESVRRVIALAVHQELKLHQMDVTTAFLNGELQEEVYMQQPEGFVTAGQEQLVCKLKRSIYGLKQSPRCWNYVLDKQLKEMGFKQTVSDPCLYVASEGDVFFIAVYVDDLILGGKEDQRISRIKKMLARRFEVKDLGELSYFLGMTVIQDSESGTIWIGQPAYTERLLQKFDMQDSKPVSTPANIDERLVKKTEDSDLVDKKKYQAAVGSLLYLSTKTRPDLAFAVGNVARFCSEPTKQHWTSVKRILRYLRDTTELGLLYLKSGNGSCVGFSDADWGGCLNDRRSTSGYMFQCNGAAISWRSNKQTCVALSTAEAEYIALSAAAQEAIWLKRLTCDILDKPAEVITIFEDNQSAICLAKNP